MSDLVQGFGYLFQVPNLPNGFYNRGVSGPYYKSFEMNAACVAQSSYSDLSVVRVIVEPEVIQGICSSPPSGGAFLLPPSNSCDKGTASGIWVVPVCGDLTGCVKAAGVFSWDCPYDVDDGEGNITTMHSYCTTDASELNWRWNCQGQGGGSTEFCFAGYISIIPSIKLFFTAP